MKVIDGGTPTAQAGMAQQVLRDPGLLDVVAVDDLMSMHVLELSEAWYAPDVVNLGDFIGADPVFDAVGGFDLGFDATLDVGWLSEPVVSTEFVSPDLGGVFDGGAAIEQGVAAGDVTSVTDAGGGTAAAGGSGFTVGGITISVAAVGAIVGALINIGFDLASDMPDDMKAVAVALDVLNLALVFIPVVGWALAIIAALFKSSILKLMAPPLTHEQRELLELKNVLERTAGMYNYYVRRATSPSLLYYGIAVYNRGDLSHEAVGGVAVALRYLSVDGRWKIIRPAGATPRADGMVQHAGSWVIQGTPQDFITSVALIPEGMEVKIQAGIALEKLEPANTYLEDHIRLRARMIYDAQHMDPDALKIMAHIWHITRDPVLNVRRWLDGTKINPAVGREGYEETVGTEMPVLTEVLNSLYYNDLALYWGFTRQRSTGTVVGDWRKLVGATIQPQWTTYHDLAIRSGRMPTLSGFLAYLGEENILTLRQHVFEGKYPVDGTTGVADFEELGLRMQALESNLETMWSRACLAHAYPYPDADWQGIYSGRVAGATIRDEYVQWAQRTTQRTVILTANGVVTSDIPPQPDYGFGTG
jgi:hypothetical protein